MLEWYIETGKNTSMVSTTFSYVKFGEIWKYMQDLINILN